jgi:hypothetical protein
VTYCLSVSGNGCLSEQGISFNAALAASFLTGTQGITMKSYSFPAQLSFITDLFSNTRLRQDFVASIVDKLQIWTGCHCVGIRIVNPDDVMPYEAYVGFSREFWEHENWLSLREHQCGCTRIVKNETIPAD